MKKQSGFAVVEAIVVLVIVAVIAGVGYYVWNRNQDKAVVSEETAAAAQKDTDTENDAAAKGSLGRGCEAGTMKGKLYTAPKAAYSICIPNGWKLTGLSNGEILVGGGVGLTYVKDLVPEVEIVEGGRDGIREFSVFYNTPAAGAPVNYNTVGQFTADNATGTEYARTETNTSNSLDLAPKGTILHAYYFEHSGKSIEIDYNLFPGDADHTDAVAAVAKTLIFN